MSAAGAPWSPTIPACGDLSLAPGTRLSGGQDPTLSSSTDVAGNVPQSQLWAVCSLRLEGTCRATPSCQLLLTPSLEPLSCPMGPGWPRERCCCRGPGPQPKTALGAGVHPADWPSHLGPAPHCPPQVAPVPMGPCQCPACSDTCAPLLPLSQTELGRGGCCLLPSTPEKRVRVTRGNPP